MKFIRDFPRKYECAISQLTVRGITISPIVGYGITYGHGIITSITSNRSVCPIGFLLVGKRLDNYFWYGVSNLFGDGNDLEKHCVPFQDGFLRTKTNDYSGLYNGDEAKLFAYNLGMHFAHKYFGQPYIFRYNEEILCRFGFDPSAKLNYNPLI